MTTLGFDKIYEIGSYLDKRLLIEGIDNSKLDIYVNNKEELKKIDEDLYYRQHPNGTDFKPSDDMITINFEHVIFNISAKDEENKVNSESKENIKTSTL